MARSLSIVVPVYDEAGNLEELHRRIAAVLADHAYDAEVILVDDASTDGSAALLDRLAGDNDAVKVIHLARNYGQTTALMAAIDHSRGDVIVPIDGDLQNDPADIPRLVAKLDEGFDVVSGWRRNRSDGPLRRLPSRIANWLIARGSGLALHDFGCTLKAYRRGVLDDMRLYGEMHRFIPVYAAGPAGGSPSSRWPTIRAAPGCRSTAWGGPAACFSTWWWCCSCTVRSTGRCISSAVSACRASPSASSPAAMRCI